MLPKHNGKTWHWIDIPIPNGEIEKKERVTFFL
jgi:hypothetical protein